MILQDNLELQLAADFVYYTNKNIFLTGKAGTGKTTFLHNLKKETPKRMVVVAPTGVAAINAGGVTMHSFFQLNFGPQLSHLIDKANMGKANKDEYAKKFNKEKIKLIKSMDLLVIDEISMVRADMLDAVDEILRRYKDKNKPFGGVQLLMIGDLNQLAPVVKDDEWQLLREHYNSMYFFDSKALQLTNPISIELKHIFRQSDTQFIDLLAKIRDNKVDKETLDILNSRHMPDFMPADNEGYIILTTHNATAQEINNQKLRLIKSRTYSFDAVVEGDFQHYNFPTEQKLELKIGAQVMFVKNDSKREKLFYNGKIGTVKNFDDDVIYVRATGEEYDIAVERETWNNVRYSLNNETKSIDENIIGSFTQFPLKLAWAITIHKSQGLTFDKAIIDAGAAFAFGQVYVALSRCRTFEGLVLRSPINQNCIKNDINIAVYNEDMRRNIPCANQLTQAKITFQQDIIQELFNFSDLKRIMYRLKKNVNENVNAFHPNLINDVELIEKQAIDTVFEVADKFKKQLESLMLPHNIPEDDNTIIERIKKASDYFLDKLQTVFVKPLETLLTDTDNKTIESLIKENLELLHKELFIKDNCLKQASKGFKAIDYIMVKANADIDFKPFQSKKQSKKEIIDYKNIPHAELFGLLKLWRKNTAEEAGMPVYWALPQKSLAKLLVELPSTHAGLQKIKGIGKVRAKQFGDDILEIINSYCFEHGIERADDVPEKPKQKKESNHVISYKLYKEGKSIKEIAAQQNFVESTIEGHLARYVALGDIDVHVFVEKEKVKLIENLFKSGACNSMGEAKSILGEKASWSELRFVVAYLKQ